MQPSARLFMTKSMYHHCKQQEHTNHVEGKMVFKDKLIWSKIRQEKKGRIKWAFPILEAYLVFLKKKQFGDFETHILHFWNFVDANFLVTGFCFIFSEEENKRTAFLLSRR